MAPLPSTDTSFPYITVDHTQAPSHDEEYQKLNHFRLNDRQLFPDEPVEYNRLDRSLPGRNIQYYTSSPDYSTLPGQVSRCNKNTELVFSTHNNIDNTSGYSSLPVTEKGQFTQCYNNRHGYMFSIFCSLWPTFVQLQVHSGQCGISYTSQVEGVW